MANSFFLWIIVGCYLFNGTILAIEKDYRLMAISFLFAAANALIFTRG